MKAVHCTTQYEWNFVNEKLTKDGINLPNHYWDTYRNVTCKNIEHSKYGDLDSYRGNTIYSFNEWCNIYGYLSERIEDEIDVVDEDLSYLIRLFKKFKIK